MHNETTALRHAIAALAPNKYVRRYPRDLRARLAAFVRAHPERATPSLARDLDMAPQTLQRIAMSTMPTALVPVRIVDDRVGPTDVRVCGPRGIVVEGLDVIGVAALIRALS